MSQVPLQYTTFHSPSLFIPGYQTYRESPYLKVRRVGCIGPYGFSQYPIFRLMIPAMMLNSTPYPRAANDVFHLHTDA